MPKISVIISTYNRCNSLKVALDSILDAAIYIGYDYEVIILDNNSTDSTKALVENYCSQNKRIGYLFEPRQGKSFALNAGIGEAKGDIIVLTDDDVIVDKNWLNAIKDAFNKHDCKCFGGKVIATWPPVVPEWLVKDGPFRISGGAIVQHDLGNESIPYNGTTQSPPGANIFFKRDIFERYGDFRTDLSNKAGKLILGEDFEFISRLKKGGEKVMYYPAAVVYHPVHESRLTKEHFERFWYAFGNVRAKLEDLPKDMTFYFGIPRYLCKQMMINILNYLFTMVTFQSQKSFYYKLELYKNIGYFAGYVKRGNK